MKKTIRRKRNNRPSFTILELLIAMSLASFVMMGLMQGYQTLVRYIERSREMMITNRRVCLLFNQIERDLMTAFIPEPHEEIIPDSEQAKHRDKLAKKKEEEGKILSDKEKKKKEQEKLEEKSKFFLGEKDEGEFTKLNKKRYERFKSLTFVTTNALQVYGEKRRRFVRVRYELVRDKKKSKGENVYFDLIRKETLDLKNVKMKIDQWAKESEQIPIRQHVVAEGLKGLYLEYITIKKEEEKTLEARRKKEIEEARSFDWGNKDYSKGVVPQRIELLVSFWNSEMTDSQSFQIIIPILSYPTDAKDDEKKKKEQAQKGAKPGAPTPPPKAPAAKGAKK